MPPHAYLIESRRSFCDLALLTPLLLAYETGVYFYGNSARNGADYLLVLLLNQSGFNMAPLLPLIVGLTLILRHALSRQQWRTSLDTIAIMLMESFLYACVLIIIGSLLNSISEIAPLFSRQSIPDPALAVRHTQILPRLTAYIGAGLYEEILFRILLIPLTYVTLRATLTPRKLAFIESVIASSLLFSLAHYMNPHFAPDPLCILRESIRQVISSHEMAFSFIFRFLAGIFFTMIYFQRGIAIAAWTHALYDILVGFVLFRGE